ILRHVLIFIGKGTSTVALKITCHTHVQAGFDAVIEYDDVVIVQSKTGYVPIKRVPEHITCVERVRERLALAGLHRRPAPRNKRTAKRVLGVADTGREVSD